MPERLAAANSCTTPFRRLDSVARNLARLRFPAMEIRMGNHQDPSDAVIEEVASILATGYLRMAQRPDAERIRQGGRRKP